MEKTLGKGKCPAPVAVYMDSSAGSIKEQIARIKIGLAVFMVGAFLLVSIIVGIKTGDARAPLTAILTALSYLPVGLGIWWAKHHYER